MSAGLRGYDRRHPPLEYVPCPLCGVRDGVVVGEEGPGFRVVRCDGCDLLYVTPRVRDPERSFWGDKEGYRRAALEVLEGRRPSFRDPNYREVLALLDAHGSGGRLLDVGSHLGFFLRLTRGTRWAAVGVEPSPPLAELAREYFGVDVRTGFLADARFPDGHFDAVTMVDVLEHVKDPRVLLAEVARVTRPGGVLVLQLPNTAFTLLKARIAHRWLGRSDFIAFDAEEHVCHYTPRTLARMLASAGFRLERVRPGKPIQWAGAAQIVDGVHMQHAVGGFAGAHLRLARWALYWLARAGHAVRPGWVPPTAANLVAVARREGGGGRDRPAPDTRPQGGPE